MISYGRIPVDRVAALAGAAPDSDQRARLIDELRDAWASADAEEKPVLAAAGRALSESARPAEGLALDEVLSRLGVTALRPGQDRAITSALAGLDTVVVMATGSGKSLCYQAPAAVLGGLSLVVSPLIALIEDQHRALTEAGLPVARLSSQLDETEQRAVLARVASGEPMLLYVAPERFNSPAFVEVVRNRGVNLFVVDEAHCVSEWGHDFRPDYRRVGEFRDRVGARATIALTATATPRVQTDIAARLGLRHPIAVTTGFDRPNITYDALNLSGRGTVMRKGAALRAALKEVGDGPTIIYSGTRRAADELAEDLGNEGWRTASYHAGRSDRAITQDAFMKGEVQVMCATNAFGMGVDKPDIRLVVHWAAPDSLEQYYQEAGRAGRDGEQSRALLLAASTDIGRIKNRIGTARLETSDVDALLARLAAAADSDGEFFLPRGTLDDRGRFELAMAERVGVVKAAPAGGGSTAGTLRAEKLDAAAAEELGNQVGRELRRRWDALDALVGYAEKERCRRAAILAYFGDAREGTPEERCCDFCARPADFVVEPVRTAPHHHEIVEPVEGLEVADRKLLDELRAWRKALAHELDWPTFRIASNRALKEIAQSRPGDVSALGATQGVAPWLVEGHADAILGIVAGAETQVSSPTARPSRSRGPAKLAADVDPEVFERLRQWRTERADGKPAYTVCGNKTLAEIARRRPAGQAALSAINGVGPAFLERHSESLFVVLEEIAA